MSEENIYRSKGEDERMLQATAIAQQTFKYFWRELSWEYRRIVPALDLAIVKVPFATNSNDENIPPFEHMWISDISFDGDIVSGYLANEPNWVQGLRSGDSVNIPLTEISDWMYVIQGRTYGGYSVQVMRESMGSAERKEHDAAWGFDFGDPRYIEVTPYRDEKPKGFLSKIFGAKGDDAGSLSDYPEHPMSENMAGEVEKILSQQPSLVSDKDEEGWTMLHREVLAGNLTPVSILVKHGADPKEKNGAGMNAVDLATKMGWNQIVEKLSTNS